MLLILCLIVFFPEAISQHVCTDPNLLQSVINGQKLEGFKIQSLEIAGLMMCGRECLYHTNCLSINFHTGSGICELNRQITNQSRPLVSSLGFLYVDISDLPSEIAGACQRGSCPPDYICVPGITGNSCYLVDCGLPPAIEFGHHLKYEGTVIGHTANYSCVRAAVVYQDVILRCSSNGTWDGPVCRKVSSCEDVQHCNTNYTDGEYWLYPVIYGNRQKVKVYCHGLNTTSPRVYVTLPPGNIADYPNLISNSTTCELKADTRTDWGKTIFNKVRIRPEQMTIVSTDYEFVNLVRGVNQRFGGAWDCTNLNGQCPDSVVGYFMINTTDTGLIINETTEWVMRGSYSIKRFINRSSEYVTDGVCGGRCGGCRPEFDLQFIMDSILLDNDKAVHVLC